MAVAITRRSLASTDLWFSSFALCLVGMTIGMALDCRRLGLIVALCSGDTSLIGAARQHVEMMPAMYAGAAFAVAITLCRDAREGLAGIARSIACSGLMMTGMTLASIAAMRIAPAAAIDPVREWLLMVAGMIAGHAVHRLGWRALR